MDNDGILKVFIRRTNLNNKASILKINSTELKDFLCTGLIPLYIKTQQMSLQQLFKDTATHNHRDPTFWLDPLTVTNMSMDIKVRPFLISDSRLAFRLYQQLSRNIEMRNDNEEVFIWSGPACSLLPFQYLSLIHKLGMTNIP